MKRAEPVCRFLESIGASYALIGGHAVSIRGYPRMTIDYDFLTTDRRVLQAETWQVLQAAGASVDARKGEYDDPLAGVVHLTLADGTECDVIVAKWKWEQGVIDRAELLDVDGVVLPVPRTSDLILLKLSAGGEHDLRDASILLRVSDRERVISEVDEHIESLSADSQLAWRRLLT